MHRRSLIAVLTAAALLAGCGASAGKDDQTVLKVGSQRGSTKAILIASGALEGTPYKIEWSEFAAAQPLLEAVSAQAVDLGEAGDAPFLFAYAGGAKIKAVQAGKSGGSSTALLVRKGSPIHGLADLRGKKIATGRGSIGHFLLLKLLEEARLKPTDVQIVFLSPGDAKAAFTSGAIDAWVTWGSYVALARLHDDATVLADGDGRLSGYGFEAASEAAIAGKRPQVEDFLRRLAKARRWAGEHPEAFAAALSKETGLQPDVALYTVQHYRIAPAEIDDKAVAEATAVLDRFRTAGAVTSSRDPAGAFDRSFNAAVAP
ncbi:ABC transporter substrate-binding protein [Caulobacter soli]|uniref:ABC transporter substrate-binding protein n=1 Tax=Caulobacter soli TaxID=2708539 RepID=UPI0013E9DD48|nr:ABC transporter substrate-binding protein [Caulobacter soli]